MRYLAGVCLLAAACGGSSGNRGSTTPRDAEAEAADRRRAEIARMKPAEPFERREQLVFAPADRCGQGPYRIETAALEAKYGERILVYACGKHRISGNYRLTTTRKSGRVDTDDSKFGFSEPDNAACTGHVVANVTGAGPAGGGGGGSAGGQGGSRGGGGTAAAPQAVKPQALAPATGIPARCTKTQLVNMTWTSTADGTGVDGHIALDLWSEQPNDFDGLVFVLEKHAVVASMTLDGWKSYNDAYDAYVRALNAAVDADVAAGRSTLIDTTVKTPPPPPPRAETPPPRPSKNARWIPGYWLYAEAQFHWIAGLWDVPVADVEQQLTVVAPTPPPVKPQVIEDRPPTPRPTATAVWTPGSWQWDGRAYVWIEGAWRIPPDAQSTWQAPRWNVSAKGAVYLPGGWKVRVRLR